MQCAGLRTNTAQTKQVGIDLKRHCAAAGIEQQMSALCAQGIAEGVRRATVDTLEHCSTSLQYILPAFTTILLDL